MNFICGGCCGDGRGTIGESRMKLSAHGAGNFDNIAQGAILSPGGFCGDGGVSNRKDHPSRVVCKTRGSGISNEVARTWCGQLRQYRAGRNIVPRWVLRRRWDSKKKQDIHLDFLFLFGAPSGNLE